MINESDGDDIVEVECAPAVQTTLGAIFVSMELSRST